MLKLPSSMLLRAPVAAISAVLALCATPALADRPMAVTTVDAPEAGEAKLEFGWDKNDDERGFGLTAGFAPIDGLELEAEFGRSRDGDTSPATRAAGIGISAKWLPLRPAKGLSAGVLAELARERTDDRHHPREHATVYGVSAIAGWRFESEQSIHLNLGREWVRESGDVEGVNTWGVAFIQPVGESLEVIAEFYGAEESRPDRQIGLRYEVVEGVKLSGAVGRGNDRSIANVGVTWEF